MSMHALPFLSHLSFALPTLFHLLSSIVFPPQHLSLPQSPSGCTCTAHWEKTPLLTPAIFLCELCCLFGVEPTLKATLFISADDAPRGGVSVRPRTGVVSLSIEPRRVFQVLLLVRFKDSNFRFSNLTTHFFLVFTILSVRVYVRSYALETPTHSVYICTTVCSCTCTAVQSYTGVKPYTLYRRTVAYTPYSAVHLEYNPYISVLKHLAYNPYNPYNPVFFRCS